MTNFLSEFLGTALLIALGDGVVANVILPKTKGNGGGLISICFGWGLAVFVAVYATAPYSGGHLNPAVTVALAWLGKFPWQDVPTYVLAQLSGAMTGALLVWVIYRQHLNEAADAATKLAVFSTGPSIRSSFQNLLTETLATFVFMIGVLFIVKPAGSLGALDALPVALLVVCVGLGLGGPTGWAINPARDLGPRIMHAILPIKNKGASDWSYSWIPVVGPILGGILAAVVWEAIF